MRTMSIHICIKTAGRRDIDAGMHRFHVPRLAVFRQRSGAALQQGTKMPQVAQIFAEIRAIMEGEKFRPWLMIRVVP